MAQSRANVPAVINIAPAPKRARLSAALASTTGFTSNCYQNVSVDSSQGVYQITMSEDNTGSGATLVGADGVTYRIVQVAADSPVSSVGANILHTQDQQRIVNADGLHQQIMTIANQTIVSSSSGSGNESSDSSQSQHQQQQRVAILPSVVNIGGNNLLSAAVSQQVHVENSGQGQYFVMMSAGDLLQAGGQSGLQSAAFIPITKLEIPSDSNKNDMLSPSRNAISPIYLGKEVKRKTSHNEVEKRRRDKINEWILKLATIVPLCGDDAGKTAQSKGTILMKTVEYIEQLKGSNNILADHLSELEKLKKEVHQLRAENRLLKQQQPSSVNSLSLTTSTTQGISKETMHSAQTNGPVESSDDAFHKTLYIVQTQNAAAKNASANAASSSNCETSGTSNSVTVFAVVSSSSDSNRMKQVCTEKFVETSTVLALPVEQNMCGSSSSYVTSNNNNNNLKHF